MSQKECLCFQKKLAFHTAPCLLGIKCAGLMSVFDSAAGVNENIIDFNRRAAARGLKMRVLCRCGGRSLVLVYNERQLRDRLKEPKAAAILSAFGYSEDQTLEAALDRLSRRVSAHGDFPHEIGVFLGYPAEDVEGFIKNKGENFLLCGCWKVYNDVESAKRSFQNYERCREYLCNKLNEGLDIYQALRIS